MCMIGKLQWAVALGRYDILAYAMSMSRLRLAPKIGHLERLKRLYWCLSKTKHFAIRYRTKEPNWFHLPIQEHDWYQIVYGNVNEEISKDIPKLLGIRVITTTFLGANLLGVHDIVTGKSVAAVLHFMNTTPIDWYSKRQATVETATYGSEFVAARTGTEQIMDLRNTLRCHVPIMTKAYMLKVNKLVITSATIPQSVLNKTQHVVIPQIARSHCSKDPRFLLVFI